MYILCFLMWIIFNGRLTWETAISGAAVSAAMYAFLCRFMDHSIRKDILIMKKSVFILQYIAVLVWEIVKANWTVMKMILMVHKENEPVLFRFKTGLRTKTARTILANSITLTPGTITVSLEEDEYVVHCLDKSLAEGMDSSVFVRLLERLEKV